MRSRRFLLLSCALLSCCVFVFSGMSLNASADEQYIRIPWGSWSSMVGSSVQGYYLADDNTLKPITLTLRTNSASKTGLITSVDMDASGSDMLVNSYIAVYECTIPSDVKQGSDSYLPYLQVDWNVHLSNVTYTGFVGGTFVNTVFTTLSRSSLVQYNYMQAGSSSASVVSLSGLSTDPNLAGLYKQSTVSSNYNCSGCYYTYNGTASDLYIGTQFFSNLRSVGSNNNKWYVMLSAPYINPDYQFVGNEPPPPPPDEPVFDGGSSGTMSGVISDNGDGTQDIHVTVETDNTGLIGGILSGIKNLFVPTDEDLQGFTDDMHTLAQDHLGGLYEAVDILDNSFSGLSNLDARESIHVNPVTIPLLGSDSLTLGNWDVPLKPSTTGGFALLYDGIALLADFIAAFAFLRMCRNKLDIILNPAAEVVSE